MPEPETQRIVRKIADKADKLRRAKSTIACYGPKIAISEKLLVDAIKSQAHYNEAVTRISADLEKMRKAFSFAIDYVAANEDDIDKETKANDIAKQIAKLQAYVKNLEIEARNLALPKDQLVIDFGIGHNSNTAQE